MVCTVPIDLLRQLPLQRLEILRKWRALRAFMYLLALLGA